MLFDKGDIVQWKHYFGHVVYDIPENKTYMIRLYGYKGFREIMKQIPEIELYKLEAI
jgi:hypothetical protein